MSNRLRYTLAGLNLFLGLNAVSGAVWVVPGLPREWLTGTPFPDYVVPALALGLMGLGACVAGVMLVVRRPWGTALSGLVGAGVMVFELVETSVVGWDLWAHALGLGPIRKGLPAVDATGITAPLGIPLPLWPQPVYFVLGAVIVALAAVRWRRQPAGLRRPARLAVRRAPHGA
jgi:hypothetical protein